MKVLLTGASGFVGRHCIPLLLERSHEVHAVSSREHAGGEGKLFWHKADLLNPSDVQDLVNRVRPTHLLHFAWYAEHGKYWTSPENLRWVQASLELLRCFATQGGERIVMAGSCAEYDWDFGTCSESSTPLVPGTLYGVCKHSLQMMLAAFSRETGLSSAWGRIFFLYGPAEQPERLVGSVIRSLLSGQPANCTHGEQVRDYMHVRQAASAFVALLESEVQGPVNIASGDHIKIKDLVQKIATRIGRPDLVRLGALTSQPADPLIVCADTSRLNDEVGWRQANPERDLDETIQWWRAQSPSAAVGDHA